MLREAIEILQRGFYQSRLFVPGLAIGALMLRLGRYYQISSQGKGWLPAKDSKDAASFAQTATSWKGLGLIFTGALVVDAWWNYGVIVAVIVTFVFLAEIYIVMRWRRAGPSHDHHAEEADS